MRPIRPAPLSALGSFIGEEPAVTPEPSADTVEKADPVEPIEVPSSEAPAAKPQATAPDYPWQASGLRKNVSKQLPIRVSEVAAAKIQWLFDRMAIRSKMGFLTNAAETAIDKMIYQALLQDGVPPEEAASISGYADGIQAQGPAGPRPGSSR